MRYAGSNEDFDRFYDNNLAPTLSDIKPLDKAHRKWLIAIIAAGLLLVLSVIGISYNIANAGIYALISLVLLGVGVYIYTRKRDAYIGAFKDEIIKAIIAHFNPALRYAPWGMVSHLEYEASSLYRRNYGSYQGNDYIEGVYKQVPFRCSELETKLPSSSQNGKVVFRGLFFIADITKAVMGGTYIWIRGDEQLPASLADQHYRYLPMPPAKEIQIGDADFQKLFSVYTTNPSEAAAILTPLMMAQMVYMRRQFQRDLSFSFVAGKCYVASVFDEELLEPPGANENPREAMRNCYFTIVYILNLIDQLGLPNLI